MSFVYKCGIDKTSEYAGRCLDGCLIYLTEFASSSLWDGIATWNSSFSKYVSLFSSLLIKSVASVNVSPNIPLFPKWILSLKGWDCYII